MHVSVAQVSEGERSSNSSHGMSQDLDGILTINKVGEICWQVSICSIS